MNGRGRQQCCKSAGDVGRRCPWRSVSGLAKGQGLCPYHWTAQQHGYPWADQCYPDWQRATAEKLKGGKP